MSSISWKLRGISVALLVVGGGTLVGASELGPPPPALTASIVRLPRPTLQEPVHGEPGPELLEEVAMVGAPDVTGARYPSGLKITGGTPHRTLLFTFDDGPSRRTTPRLLDMLDELGIRAVFFVTGESFGNGNPWEREHAEIVRDIVRRGHTVGNHTETHRQLPLLSSAEIEAELRRSANKIAWTVGNYPRLIRPPGGALSTRVEGLLADHGYTSVMWTVYPADLEERTPEGVARTFFRVLDRREQETGDRGGIVLMHDTRPHSVDALPRIVDALERRNCRLLAAGDELYDIVDDLGYFISGYPTDETLDERQQRLVARFEHECRSLAMVD